MTARRPVNVDAESPLKFTSMKFDVDSARFIVFMPP
jgi:hypothetical protein